MRYSWPWLSVRLDPSVPQDFEWYNWRSSLSTEILVTTSSTAILETQEKQERIRNRGPQQAQGFKVGRNMQRYRADPGSIFDLDDPTDVEFGTHRDENTGK